MSWSIPKTWTSGAVLTKTDLDTHVRDNLAFLKTNIALEEAPELTIVNGEVIKTCSHHAVAAESGTADDLDTISGGSEGDIILLRAAVGDTITLKHAVGNIWIPSAADIVLSDTAGYVILVYSGSEWCAIKPIPLSFASLLDVPPSYTDEGGKLVAVKAAEDGLEFVDAAGQGTLTEVLGWVILFIPAANGLYYDDDNFDVRIRTSAIDAGGNILMQGYNVKNDCLLIFH